MDDGPRIATIHTGLGLQTYGADPQGIFRRLGQAALIKIAEARGCNVAELRRETLIDDDLNLNAKSLLVDSNYRVIDLTKKLRTRTFPDGTKDLVADLATQHLEKRLTTVAGAGYRPDWQSMPNPILDHIKDQIFDKETLTFFLWYLGASLRGDVRRKLLMFIINPGKNTGKSLLVDILIRLFGDYIIKVPSSLFDRSKSDQLLKFLYRHRFARIVVSDEISRSLVPDVSTMKQITGEDALDSPYAYGTASCWSPPRLFIFDTNQRSGRESEEDELADRSFLIPYGISLGPKDRDSNLLSKLTTQENLDVFFSFLLARTLNGTH